MTGSELQNYSSLNASLIRGPDWGEGGERGGGWRVGGKGGRGGVKTPHC